MAEWWLNPPAPPPYERCLFDPYSPEKPALPVLPPQAQQSLLPPAELSPPPMLYMPPPKLDNPREIRNKAEKQRRDKLNQSIAELASLVPPVVYSAKKIDKTGVLRYTAHYLRAHQYVFDPPPETSSQFSHSSTQAILGLLNGFLLTITYKGLIVVVSQNINEYLGYTELELLGKSIFSLVHEGDRELLRDQLMPRSQALGKHGELLVPNEEEGRKKIAQALANERRRFIIRFLKLGQRSEPIKYVTCHVEGSFRISDRALQGYNRCCQMVRRARARGDNPCSSGNDVVFIGVVRPCTETFINESALESYRMEYRTRHSIDGEIIQCEQRIAIVTGYMINEVKGINAMNFIHRDEVRWVITALKEMYNQKQLFGESCYRLMTKNGQFIYMRTRGRLDVDSTSRRVTSFVCTNTLVDDREGKQLVKMMKERFILQAGYDGHLPEDDTKEANDSQGVEDPRQLEKAILNMVTTLPSADDTDSPYDSPSRGESPHRLALIPPKKERIVSAIEKIYTVIKIIPKQPTIKEEDLVPIIQEERLLTTTHEEKPQITYEKTIEAMTPSCSDASNLPPFNEFFQAQSGSEAETSETYSPVTSSDFDSVMTSSRDEMSFVFDEVDSTQPGDFELLSSAMNRYDKMVANASPGLNNTAGVKRPRIQDREMTSKKKTGVKTNTADGQASGRGTPTLETFFDEEVLMTHIQSAMETLEETVDPIFPEFLSSREVEEILGTNHRESGEK